MSIKAKTKQQIADEYGVCKDTQQMVKEKRN